LVYTPINTKKQVLTIPQNSPHPIVEEKDLKNGIKPAKKQVSTKFTGSITTTNF